MPVFHFFLKDLVTRGDWGEGTMFAIGTGLKDIFDEVCRHEATPYTSSEFHWDPAASNVTGDALLLYFVPDVTDSPILRGGNLKMTVDQDGANEITGDGTLSEVYVSTFLNSGDTKVLIHVAFHELMHNKLRMTDAQLHTLNGPLNRPSFGLADEVVSVGSKLTTIEQKRMAIALTTNVRQNTVFL